MTRTWVLDLDNTLYPRNSGLFACINQRIDRFMESCVGISPAAVPRLREAYRQRFGITLSGLMAEHQVEPEQYLAYVHDVPLAPYLRRDPNLVAALGALEGRKVVFTNGSVAHARAVLAHLGLDGLVETVFDIAFMDYVPKPFPHGYRKLLQALGAAPGSCWLVDDLVANLDTARELGMHTVLVGPAPAPGHAHLRRVEELAAWQWGGGSGCPATTAAG